jgi:signal transduction histidine kinase
LLRLSRAGRNADFTESVVLDAVLDEAVSRLQIPVQESRAEILRSPALPEKLRGSAADLALLFFELFANALEFRRDGVPLQIEIGVGSPLSEKPSALHLYVRDNGIGMESRYLGEVFLACRKLLPDSHDRLGIGLTICRKLTDRYGERIWIESSPGRGTTVHFTWTCTT